MCMYPLSQTKKTCRILRYGRGKGRDSDSQNLSVPVECQEQHRQIISTSSTAAAGCRNGLFYIMLHRTCSIVAVFAARTLWKAMDLHIYDIVEPTIVNPQAVSTTDTDFHFRYLRHQITPTVAHDMLNEDCYDI